MKRVRKIGFAIMLGVALVSLQGCSPEIGSKEWCAELKEKPKGDWSANEAKEFAKSCLF